VKASYILIVVVSLVILAAVGYMFTAAESPEAYVEKIEKERERQFKFIRFNVESPLTEAQKQSLQTLTFYDINPSYRVKARLLPIENKKVRQVPLTDGSVEKYIEHSYAEFELNGQTNKVLLLQSVKETDMRNFFLAFADEEACGASRWRKPDQGYKLERFAVLKPFRGKGVGSALIAAVLNDLPADAKYVYLNSQLDAVNVYKKFGFLTEGEQFEEAGIQHFKMVRKSLV
jgi:predicted GNAT family N-acyltransferase